MELEKTEKKQIDFLKDAITRASKWNNELIKRFHRESFGINDVPIVSYLSTLRHFSVPVPYLDFTQDHNIALYFSASTSNYHSTDEEIGNYFSIYILKGGGACY